MSERQTLSYLAKVLERAGLTPKTKYGQNFLVDLNLLDILMNGADLTPNDVVLEVGTGLGSLTKLISKAAGKVVSIEVDRDLFALAGRELKELKNARLLNFDALRNKNNLRTEIFDAVRESMLGMANVKFKLVSNLPYNVATPIISNLLTCEPLVDRMVVTIQKELADRIIAKPSCKDYSALSIWIQAQCDCSILRVLPPTVFWPQPKVDSAIIQIDTNPKKRARIQDLEYFHSHLRSLFFHRRKYLRSQLATSVQDELDKSVVDEILTEQNLAPNLRAEQLSVEQIIGLLEACRKRMP